MIICHSDRLNRFNLPRENTVEVTKSITLGKMSIRISSLIWMPSEMKIYGQEDLELLDHWCRIILPVREMFPGSESLSDFWRKVPWFQNYATAEETFLSIQLDVDTVWIICSNINKRVYHDHCYDIFFLTHEEKKNKGVDGFSQTVSTFACNLIHHYDIHIHEWW